MWFPAPKELPLRPFAHLPDRLRNLRRSSWADANRAGAPIDSFLEGPCFDRAGRFLVTDIPNGRILLVGPGQAWEVLAEYDGWPNGLALGVDDALLIADYRHGLLTLDPEGHIVGANPAARQMLSLSPVRLGQPLHVSEVFASPWESLFDAAQRDAHLQELPLWSGLRLQTQALRPGKKASALSHPPQAPATASGSKPLRDLQTDLIRDTVTRMKGNVAEAARILGISRATVYRKLGLRK